jgi:hypothetical protein
MPLQPDLGYFGIQVCLLLLSHFVLTSLVMVYEMLLILAKDVGSPKKTKKMPARFNLEAG